MRNLPTVPHNGTVEALTNVLRELLRVLGRDVLDYSLVTVEKTWSAPFDLALPTRAGNSAPQIVRLGRAVVAGEPETPVAFGSTTWTWTGAGVRIHDVDGLVTGTSYKLTFEVIG